VRKFLASVAISENKTIESMTERQRQAVTARLTTAQAGVGSSQQAKCSGPCQEPQSSVY
jgi:hypothetical protein